MGSSPLIDSALEKALIGALKKARTVVASTGAGTSAESGIATFREAQTGLWSRFRPEDLATPQAFEKNPQRVWEWYQWRREKLREVEPNPGHVALAKMARLLRDFRIVTQNVDGLHQQAGSEEVLELHGSIVRNICHLTGREIDLARLRDSSGSPPRSPHHAEGLVRPAVVWFGEALPARVLESAIEACRSCEVFFSIGTSSLVEPAASLPLLARENGALVVEINPEPTPLTPVADIVMPGRSGEILPRITELLQQSLPHPL
jgi:NAD-dependent deacetylase